MDGTKEALGYLARWSLLALAMAVVVAVAAMAVMGATQTQLLSSAPEMVFSDAVWSGSAPFVQQVMGLVRPAAEEDPSELLLCQGPGNQVALSVLTPHWGVLRFPGVWSGPRSLRLCGLPYTRRAGSSDEIVVLIPAADRPVVVLEARDFIPPDADEISDDVREAVEALARSSSIVWLFGGTLEEFARVRRVVRGHWPAVPLVYRTEQPWLDRGHVFGFLHHSGLKERPVSIVTRRGELASAGIDLGLTVHVIDRERPQTALPDRVRYHQSLLKFKESLPTKPIR